MHQPCLSANVDGILKRAPHRVKNLLGACSFLPAECAQKRLVRSAWFTDTFVVGYRGEQVIGYAYGAPLPKDARGRGGLLTEAAPENVAETGKRQGP